MNGIEFEKTYVPEDFRLKNWLLETDLSLGAKLTYAVLACCCGGRDYVWPTLAYLARRVSASERTVQRYLKELAAFGLIRIEKKEVKGRFRTVYQFLRHVLVEVAPAKSERRSGFYSGVKTKKETAVDQMIASKTAIRGDKNDRSLNKEETILEKKIPPTSQSDEKVFQATSQPAETPVSGGEFFEQKILEDPAWVLAKQILAEKLSAFDLDCWIKPALFERAQSRVVLRLPNDFFRRQVKKNYESVLTEALAAVGLSGPDFEVMSSAEIEALERQQEEKVLIKLKPQPKEAIDLEKLSNEEAYQKFYENYPRKEKLEKGWQTFRRLHKKNELPSLGELLKAVKRQRGGNPAWQRDQGRYIPQLHNWLLEKRWLD